MRLLAIILGLIAVVEGFLLGFNEKSIQEPPQPCTHILPPPSPKVAVGTKAESTISIEPKILRYSAAATEVLAFHPYSIEEKNILAAYSNHFQAWNLNEADARVVCKILIERKAVLLETLQVASEMHQKVNPAILAEVLKKNDEQLRTILGENGLAKIRNNSVDSRSPFSFEEYIRIHIQ